MTGIFNYMKIHMDGSQHVLINVTSKVVSSVCMVQIYANYNGNATLSPQCQTDVLATVGVSTEPYVSMVHTTQLKPQGNRSILILPYLY